MTLHTQRPCCPGFFGPSPWIMTQWKPLRALLKIFALSQNHTHEIFHLGGLKEPPEIPQPVSQPLKSHPSCNPDLPISFSMQTSLLYLSSCLPSSKTCLTSQSSFSFGNPLVIYRIWWYNEDCTDSNWMYFLNTLFLPSSLSWTLQHHQSPFQNSMPVTGMTEHSLRTEELIAAAVWMWANCLG